MMGLNGLGSTRPGGGGDHGCALADSRVFERSQPAQMAAMVAGGLANVVLPKSIVYEVVVGRPAMQHNTVSHRHFGHQGF